MENRSTRTTLSLLLSLILHSSAIALIALGPAFIPGMLGKGDRESRFVEVDLAAGDSHETSNDVVAATQAQPIETVQPQQQEVTPVASVAAQPVVAAPVVAAAKPTPKAEGKIVKVRSAEKAATSLPEKAETSEPQIVAMNDTKQADSAVLDAPKPKLAEQPAIEAQDGEVAVDQTTEQAAEEEAVTPPVVAQPAEQAPQKMTEETDAVKAAEEVATPATDSQFTEEKPTEKPTETEQAAITSAPATAPASAAVTNGSTDGKTAAGDANDASAGSTKESSVASAVPTATGPVRDFADLKQAPGNKPPVYTREMRLKRLQGRGKLEYYVSKDGRIENMRLVESTGSKQLDQAAIDAFSKYKFIPGQQGFASQEFEFALRGPEETDFGRLRTTMSGK